jgi:murein L,D-transpeptidase YafK
MKLMILLLSLLSWTDPAAPGGPGDGHLNPATIDKDKIFLLIDKSNYRLYLYEDTRLLKTYKVVFGNNDLGDKRMQGDRETPEGTFHIVEKHDDKRWNKFMLLDYPTASDEARFRAMKARGRIPSSARIGGGIGIHGVRPGVQSAIDLKINGTNGCIGMKNADVDELFRIVAVGTPVVIRR